jgi:hypothetical protein
MKEVAMRAVNFNHLKTREESAAGCRHEGIDNDPYFRICQLERRRIVCAKGQRAGSDGRPSALRFRNKHPTFPRYTATRLPSGMRDLDSRNGALLLDKRSDSTQLNDVVVLPYSQIGRCDSPARFNGRRLCKDQAGAPDRPATEMNEMPTIRESILARILAHR